MQAHPQAQAKFKAYLRPLLRQVASAFPQATVELWAINEHHCATHAWTMMTACLANVRKEAGQLDAPQLTEEEIQAYFTDLHGVLQAGEMADRQEILRRFIRSIVLYSHHIEIAYNIGLSTPAPLGEFGVADSP